MRTDTHGTSPAGPSAVPAGGTDLSQLLVLRLDRISAVVSRLAGRRLLRFDALEDLNQQVVLEALAHPGHFAYRDEDQFLHWIWTVADRVVRARARAARHTPAPLASPFSDAASTASFQIGRSAPRDPQSIVEQRERAVRVRASLAVLSSMERDTVDALYYRGSSVKDHAAMSGCSEEVVWQRHCRALGRLRTLHRGIEGPDNSGRGSAPAPRRRRSSAAQRDDATHAVRCECVDVGGGCGGW
ncbi:MAG: sigma-70 family RNA polymerase sigma factor [Phycisphaerales bacterium]|nr:MAG: sigma-70 family RNA polymerase sigma factor [Phycisphaerales bacterium]